MRERSRQRSPVFCILNSKFGSSKFRGLAPRPCPLPKRFRPPAADGPLHQLPQLRLGDLLQRFAAPVELALAGADRAVALAQARQLARLSFGLAVFDGVEAAVEAPLFGLDLVLFR